MFNPSYIIGEMENNLRIFSQLFSQSDKALIFYRPSEGKWNMQEILCHLYDEEREDFRARLAHVLSTPELPLPSIDPQGWVSSRKYGERNYAEVLSNFLSERKVSVDWLKSLKNPDWSKAYQHPKFGPMSAKLFLCNWLAHDYLHIRQLLYTKHAFLSAQSGEDLSYAGSW